MSVLDQVAANYKQKPKSKLDIVSENYTPSIKPLRTLGSEIRKGYVSDYDSGFTPMYKDLNLFRANRQSTPAQAFNSIVGGLGGGALTFLEDAGYILDFENNINTIRGVENLESNAFSKFMKDNKEALYQALPIYRKNPNATFDPSDGGWYWDMFRSVIESATAFGGVGMGAGALTKMIGKGITKAAGLNRWGNMIGQSIETGKTGLGMATFISSTGEGKMMALELYDEAFKKGLEDAINTYKVNHNGESPDADTLNKIQLAVSDEAGKQANWFMLKNYSLGLIEASQLKSLFKATGLTRGDIAVKPTFGSRLWDITKAEIKNSPKEGFEELLQNALQREGQYQTEKNLQEKYKINPIEPISTEEDFVNRFIDFATTDKALLEGLMGLVSGPIQYTVTKLPFTNFSAESKKYTDQQTTIEANREFIKASLLQTGERTKQIEEALQNNQTDRAKVLELQEFDQLALRNFQLGTTQKLVDTLNETIQSNESTPDQKTSAQEYLKRLEAMEQEYTTMQRYSNAGGVFQNRLLFREFNDYINLVKKGKETLKQNIQNQFTPIVEAYNNVNKDNPISMSTILDAIESNEFSNVPEQIRDVVMGNPDVKDAVSKRNSIEKSYGELVKLQQEYKELTKPEYQVPFSMFKGIMDNTKLSTQDKAEQLELLEKKLKDTDNEEYDFVTNYIARMRTSLEDAIQEGKDALVKEEENKNNPPTKPAATAKENTTGTQKNQQTPEQKAHVAKLQKFKEALMLQASLDDDKDGIKELTKISNEQLEQILETYEDDELDKILSELDTYKSLGPIEKKNYISKNKRNQPAEQTQPTQEAEPESNEEVFDTTSEGSIDAAGLDTSNLIPMENFLGDSQEVQVKPTSFKEVPVLVKSREEGKEAESKVFEILNTLSIGQVLSNSEGEIKIITTKSTDKKGNTIIGITTFERNEDGSLSQIGDTVFSSRSKDGKTKSEYNPHTIGRDNNDNQFVVTDEITNDFIDLSKEKVFTTDENGDVVETRTYSSFKVNQPKQPEAPTETPTTNAQPTPVQPADVPKQPTDQVPGGQKQPSPEDGGQKPSGEGVGEEVQVEPKKYSLNRNSENQAPSIDVNTDVDWELSGLENGPTGPGKIKSSKLLEIRGRNSDGKIVGSVYIVGDEGSETFEVFLNDSVIDKINQPKPTNEVQSRSTDESKEIVTGQQKHAEVTHAVGFNELTDFNTRRYRQLEQVNIKFAALENLGIKINMQHGTDEFTAWAFNGTDHTGHEINFFINQQIAQSTTAAKRALQYFNDLKAGKELDPASYQFMVDQLEIRLSVSGVSGAFANLFTVKPIKGEGNATQAERNLRQNIINNLLNDTPAVAKVMGQYGGDLQVTDKEFPAISIPEFGNPQSDAEVDKTVQLLYVDSQGYLNDVKGRKRVDIVELQDTRVLLDNDKPMAGAIFTVIKKGNGQPFPLKLNVTKLSSNDKKAIFKLFEDLSRVPEKNVNLFQKEVPERILKYLSEADRLYFSKTPTYSELLSYLVFEGDSSKSNPVTQLYLENGVLIFGDNTLDFNDAVDKQAKLNALNEFFDKYKQRAINFRKLESSPKYKAHVLRSGLLTTNANVNVEGGGTLFRHLALADKSLGLSEGEKMANRFLTGAIYVNQTLEDKPKKTTVEKNIKPVAKPKAETKAKIKETPKATPTVNPEVLQNIIKQTEAKTEPKNMAKKPNADVAKNIIGNLNKTLNQFNTTKKENDLNEDKNCKGKNTKK